jgi:nucleoside 2-deoxyribosyltransferase
MPRVYCAGPLFNDSERQEMENIATVLERGKMSTFLPHRDGLEFARLRPALGSLGVGESQAGNMLSRAIFSLDVYQLLQNCDAVVANLNGRVPDEGTVVEASLAWHAGKPLVLYKADSRSMLEGSDNPMLVGLGGFCVHGEMASLAHAVELQIAACSDRRVSDVLDLGARVARLTQDAVDDRALAASLKVLLG